MPSGRPEPILRGIAQELGRLLKASGASLPSALARGLSDFAVNLEDGLEDVDVAWLAAEALLSMLDADEEHDPRLGPIAIQAVLGGLGRRVVRVPTSDAFRELKRMLFDGERPAELVLDLRNWFDALLAHR